MRVFCAVVEHHTHAGRLRASALELPAFQGAAQLHDLRGRLRKVDVQRVDLLNEGELRGLALTHQGAFGDQGAADAARNRSRDEGVVQVDAGGLDRGLTDGDIGGGLLACRLRVHILLLADGPRLSQGLEAFGLCLGLRQVGLGLGQQSLRARKRGLVRARINLEQGLARFHVAAFTKQPLLQDARGPGPDLSHARRLQPARQLGDQAHVTWRHRDDTDLGRRWAGAAGACRARRLVIVLAAARQNRGAQPERQDPHRQGSGPEEACSKSWDAGRGKPGGR